MPDDLPSLHRAILHQLTAPDAAAVQTPAAIAQAIGHQPLTVEEALREMEKTGLADRCTASTRRRPTPVYIGHKASMYGASLIRYGDRR